MKKLRISFILLAIFGLMLTGCPNTDDDSDFIFMLAYIDVKTQPDKLDYEQGETLDLTGLEITLVYSDNTTEDIVFEDFKENDVKTSPAHGDTMYFSQHDSKPISINYKSLPLLGKTNNITIDSAFLRKPYYYPGTGKTYNGFSGTEGERTNQSVTITYPSESNFSADGFFTLEGTVNNPSAYNYAQIRLMNNSDPDNLRTNYYVRNNFKIRIWLRFGPGDYTIQVSRFSGPRYPTFNLNGDGDISGSWDLSREFTFTVTNTRDDDISADSDIPDMRFIYPSYVVQSDDIRITDLAKELTNGLTDDTDKIKAIHDYIVKNTVYDNASLVPNQRKKQDALTVLGTRYFVDSQYTDGHYVAVCEGYANLFAALTRAAGFETRYISGMNHGWNHIFVNGGWKFIDVTWNDPTRSNAPAGTVDFGPDYVRYTYFLLDSLNGVNDSHAGDVNQGRSLIGGIIPPSYVLDGWY